jgi:hypothetical protein
VLYAIGPAKAGLYDSNHSFAIITGDIQSGSPTRRVPATCQDRQGAIAQSSADVVATSDNKRSRRA